MEYIICIAGILGSSCNLFLLAWADRARGFASFISLCVLILHYESLLRALTGYKIVIDLATSDVAYGLINSLFLLYWCGAVLEYRNLYRRFKKEKRRWDRLHSLSSRQNDS